MQTLEIIKIIFITSIYCIGLWIITEPGMLLHFLKKPFIYSLKNKTIFQKVLRKVLTPVIGCLSCMGSVHTFVVFFIVYGRIEWCSLPYIFLCAIAVSGTNVITYAIYRMISNISLNMTASTSLLALKTMKLDSDLQSKTNRDRG